MTCCTGPGAAAAHFNPKKADRDLRRYQRHGPDATTRTLLSELRRWPLRGLHLLDVGGGIGVIAMELASAGLASVTLADASAGYLEVARRHLASRDASLPAQFILGDFATTAGSLPDADVVTLDRVVCCYPDVEALLRGASALRSWSLLDLSAPPATPSSSGPSTFTAAHDFSLTRETEFIAANPGRRAKYAQCGAHRSRPCRRLHTAARRAPVRVFLISCRGGRGLGKFLGRKPLCRSRVSGAQRFGGFFKDVICNVFQVARGRGGPADSH